MNSNLVKRIAAFVLLISCLIVPLSNVVSESGTGRMHCPVCHNTTVNSIRSYEPNRYVHGSTTHWKPIYYYVYCTTCNKEHLLQTAKINEEAHDYSYQVFTVSKLINGERKALYVRHKCKCGKHYDVLIDPSGV